ILYAFPELHFIRILYNKNSVFQPRCKSDVICIPMTHNPYLPRLNTPIDFLLSITASFHLKSTSALMFSRVLT
ncbi:unnamed protein product, partial [Hymenolepis diminuta]